MNDHIKYLDRDYKGYNIDFKEYLSEIIIEESPIIVKVYENLTESESLNKERMVIKSIGRRTNGDGPLFNKTIGGNGTSGYKYSKERLEIAKEEYGLRFGDQSGKNHYMYGKKHSEKTKEKISKSHKGKKLTDEHKEYIIIR